MNGTPDSGPTTPRSGFALDVVGIGALNLDYLIHSDHDSSGAPGGDRAPLSARIGALLEDGRVLPEWGTEAAVDEATVYAALEAVNPSALQTSLGGSAYNAVSALAQMQLDLRLGYVGVAGRVPGPGLSAVQQLDLLGVDHQFVFRDDDHLCGVCFAFTEEGERTLLTHAGANAAMADHIEASFEDLVAYLASARVIHVTSFLDERTPGRLLSVLEEVKRVNPNSLISFDPGHVWSHRPTSDITAMVALSDFLLLNHREFRELGSRSEDESDDITAARLLSRLNNDRGAVIVKRRSGISAWRRHDEKVVNDFYPQVVLSEDEIEDATGAGDVFAAGLLSVLTADRLQIELGSLLGMTLAREKLRYVGSYGHHQLAGIAQNFIRTMDASRHNGPMGVFVAHGRSPQWLAVKSFVEERFGVPVYSFESDSWGSRPVTEALTEYMDRCSFAVCVLTAEDATGDGQLVARQNVVHEIGLFQGYRGVDRVLVLVEEGCDSAPAAAADFTVTFPRHAIGQALWPLQQALQNNGFEHV
ncbi:PfkB family carbohydrate kinase [Streptomyces sp. NPDC050145]|uniref:PfkB family carbohydrate kinase n=1 Tax=Streptomyces sp. NPDC050145 TaxID=3365602 RepID=UPI0037BAF2E5